MENRAFTPLEKKRLRLPKGNLSHTTSPVRKIFLNGASLRDKSLTGFTYIEVLIAILILGLVLVPLLSQFYIGFQGNKNAELVTQAVDLAADIMEEVKSRQFDENIFPDEPVSAGALGTDAGENANDRTTFDDVDDYLGWQKSPPQTIDGVALTDFSQFSRSVSVGYVTLSGSNWVSSGTTTHYKKIVVTVTHPKIANRVLETIVSHY